MALKNFEKLTFELDDYEKKYLLNPIINGLKVKIGKENAVTSGHTVSILKKHGYKISGARFRKIIQYIRVNDLVKNLIATSKGYYVSNDPVEREGFLLSLKQRIQSMTTTYDAMEKQHKLTNPH